MSCCSATSSTARTAALPHREVTSRRFVLEPLLELDPDLPRGSNGAVQAILDARDLADRLAAKSDSGGSACGLRSAAAGGDNGGGLANPAIPPTPS